MDTREGRCNTNESQVGVGFLFFFFGKIIKSTGVKHCMAAGGMNSK